MDWKSLIQNSKVAGLNPHLFQEGDKPGTKKRKVRKDCKQKIWVRTQLEWFCRINGYTLETEYKFHPFRKFRFDWCIKEFKIAVEYNGLISEKSRHTTITGYSADMDKINLAQSEGFIVLQYTVLNYKSIITDIEKIIK